MGGAPKKAEVQNIVASTRLADKLDLDAVVPILEGAQYDTERFPGLVYRMKKPKTALLLFRTGKVVCTGGKSLDDVREAVEIVAGKLHEAGMPVERHPEITVQNIVAVCDLGSDLNLNNIAISLDMNMEYEPEQFPGLVLRLEDPKIVCLLFGSGKMVLTGAKNTEDLDQATESVREILSRSGLL
ncbi:MAG: TATA-box-binding protein [Thermoplasmata archaeon]|nr:TATA-box-binding protein [Thermoplasmata archaeon]